MTRNLNISLKIPDKLYMDVVSPAKKSNMLEYILVQCLDIYDRNQPFRDLIDALASDAASADLSALTIALNDSIGAMGSDIEDLADIYKTPTEGPVLDSEEDKRIDSLNERVSDLENSIHEILAIVKTDSESKDKKELPSVSHHLRLDLPDESNEDVNTTVYPETSSTGNSQPIVEDSSDSDDSVDALDIFSSLVGDDK